MIPLEDSFSDVIGKAQRGLKFTDEVLAQAAGVEDFLWGLAMLPEFQLMR